MSNGLVLMDESGDLGWDFSAPYRQGGSSRFFTIAAALGHNNEHRKFGQMVRDFRQAHGWTSKHEKKWIHLGDAAKLDFAKRAADLRKKQANVKLLVSVIEKQRVPPQIHGHHHLIYSWMASSLVAPAIRELRQASLCPDELNYGNGQSLIDNFIRQNLWFNLRTKTELHLVPRSKALEDGLSFCDFLAGAVQSHFEDGKSAPFNHLTQSNAIFLHMPWH
ncbi:MAG: DUF3800 domain-containing protein [Azovibrio sp.]|uniref:DUF3800 domain-containing protein n=1 Tax=Azovibrio sp. TaxID=1872673 RepID=UPI003C728391